MRIVLVRHGRPDLTADARQPIAGTRLGEWCRGYDAVGIAPASLPPESLRKTTASAGCIVTSDLRRAVESARLLAGPKAVQFDPDLREVGFPERLDAPLRLSPGAWVAIARAVWLFDGCECEESRRVVRTRAARLVDRLSDLALAHDSVVAVGHGWFNLFVGRELRRRHWRGPRLAPRGYWACAAYERDVS
jgi:broad specificity phosphatase PhoE